MLRVFKVLKFNKCENVHRMFSEHYFENVRMQHSDTTIREHSQNSQQIVFLHNVRVIFGRHEQITKHCTHCGEYSRIFAPSWVGIHSKGQRRQNNAINIHSCLLLTWTLDIENSCSGLGWGFSFQALPVLDEMLWSVAPGPDMVSHHQQQQQQQQ